MTKTESLRKVPAKNYVFLVIIFLTTFLLAYYLYKWYDAYSTYQNSIPVIRDTLPEVTEEEMEHYIQETPTTTIYVCTASDITCRNFEKKFKKLVEQSSLKEYITYVNLEEENKEEFLNRFNINHPYRKIGLKKYPALIYFEDGKVVDMLQSSKDEELTISDVKKFIKNNKIGTTY